MEYRNNTRHLEVQIVGDKYGNAVALNGNDFVDLHFCHLFAEGTSRELARRFIVMAFKEIQGEGQFRMTREHLVRFLESETFQQNLF